MGRDVVLCQKPGIICFHVGVNGNIIFIGKILKRINAISTAGCDCGTQMQIVSSQSGMKVSIPSRRLMIQKSSACS